MNVSFKPRDNFSMLPLKYRCYAYISHSLTALGKLTIRQKHPAIVLRNRLNRLMYRTFFKNDAIYPVLTKEGFKILVPLNDQAAASILFEHEYDPQQTWVLLKFVPHISSFIDVGANLGYFSLLMRARLDKKLPVIAIEPNKKLCLFQEDSMKLNGFVNYQVVEAAMGDTTGQVQFSVDDSLSSNAKITASQPLSGKPSHSTVNWVKVVTIDEIVPSHTTNQLMPLIKIDVEGYEIKVLQGSKRVLQEGAILICEISQNTQAEINRIAKDYDYEVVDFHGNNFSWESHHKKDDVILIPAVVGEKFRNLLKGC